MKAPPDGGAFFSLYPVLSLILQKRVEILFKTNKSSHFKRT